MNRLCAAEVRLRSAVGNEDLQVRTYDAGGGATNCLFDQIVEEVDNAPVGTGRLRGLDLT